MRNEVLTVLEMMIDRLVRMRESMLSLKVFRMEEGRSLQKGVC